MSVSIRITIDGTTDPKSALLTAKEVNRVNRQVANKMMRDVRKEVGGSIPKASGTSVAGYRRKRVFFTNAKVKQKNTRASIWLGGNRIAARYGGKMRNTTGGAKAGRHFFKDAFVATMGNGYTSIFRRGQGDKLVQETIPVLALNRLADRALLTAKPDIEKVLNREINKLLKNKVTKNVK